MFQTLLAGKATTCILTRAVANFPHLQCRALVIGVLQRIRFKNGGDKFTTTVNVSTKLITGIIMSLCDVKEGFVFNLYWADF